MTVSGGSVNLFDFVTALVITRNVFQLTCVCLVTLSVAALVIRGMVSVDPCCHYTSTEKHLLVEK